MKHKKTLSTLRSKGFFTVIDKVTINLNIRKDRYEAEFSNLGIKRDSCIRRISTKV